MRVTSKGQVTIPRDFRELVGIEPNSEVIFAIENGKLTLSPKSAAAASEDRHRLDAFLQTLDALEGSGDQSVDAEALMGMTRDR
ncbi:AbrB/MazE/SpoVT family DNA-binding domain-containing protein [Rhizobium halophytocola]|uniref:AbrB family looped-hinge helix DNA binding protein n=1 Tax=Rhizobium halophytocola TaxID=735519 RepID=A0ABS4DT25_9HYPH|nr:AbrB/MazE/SpoVT family DNA-binding domain-containing protein [Rhizobium halophytocola]MBP1848841.1 AbrB family looped-hinge helix DNA binding protein [Rhizobium halophytocola]